jgi:hypothetical protein
MKITTSCVRAEGDRRFTGWNWLHHQGDGCSTHVQNASLLQRHYTALYSEGCHLWFIRYLGLTNVIRRYRMWVNAINLQNVANRYFWTQLQRSLLRNCPSHPQTLFLRRKNILRRTTYYVASNWIHTRTSTPWHSLYVNKVTLQIFRNFATWLTISDRTSAVYQDFSRTYILTVRYYEQVKARKTGPPYHLGEITSDLTLSHHI